MKLKNSTQPWQENGNDDSFVRLTNRVMMFNVKSSVYFDGFKRCNVHLFEDKQIIKILFSDNGEYIIGKTTTKCSTRRRIAFQQINTLISNIDKSKRYEVFKCEGGVYFKYETVQSSAGSLEAD